MVFSVMSLDKTLFSNDTLQIPERLKIALDVEQVICTDKL